MADGAREATAEARARLARGETVRVRVGGGSMAPTLALGTEVLARAGHPAVGDVVLIATRAEPIVHRLVARLGPLYVHAGDALGAGLGLCRAGDVLGVVEGVARRTPSRLVQATHLGRALGGALVRRLRVKAKIGA